MKIKKTEGENRGIDFVGLLPPRLILLVFSFLSISELQSLAEIARQWRKLASDNQLWDKVLYKLINQFLFRMEEGFIHNDCFKEQYLFLRAWFFGKGFRHLVAKDIIACWACSPRKKYRSLVIAILTSNVVTNIDEFTNDVSEILTYCTYCLSQKIHSGLSTKELELIAVGQQRGCLTAEAVIDRYLKMPRSHIQKCITSTIGNCVLQVNVSTQNFAAGCIFKLIKSFDTALQQLGWELFWFYVRGKNVYAQEVILKVYAACKKSTDTAINYIANCYLARLQVLNRHSLKKKELDTSEQDCIEEKDIRLFEFFKSYFLGLEPLSHELCSSIAENIAVCLASKRKEITDFAQQQIANFITADNKYQQNMILSELRIYAEAIGAKLKAKLWETLEQSKWEASLAEEASLAITCLNKSGEVFSGKNLAGVRIPRADLRQVIADGTDFTGADLRGVRFFRAFLRNSNFSGTNLTEIIFGKNADQKGYAGLITSVTYLPDGKGLAIGCWDGTVKLWDVSNSRNYHTFFGYHSPIMSIKFSPDGEILATRSLREGVTLWEVATDRNFYTLCRREAVNCIAFSPDGKILAIGDDDKKITFWEVATGKKLSTSFLGEHYSCDGFSDYVTSIMYLPNGMILATVVDSVYDDGSIELWDVVSCRKLHNLSGHTGEVNCVICSPSGKTLVTGSNDRSVKLWEVSTGQNLHTLVGHTGRIMSVAYSPDGKTLATGSNDRSVKLWDLATGRNFYTFIGHTKGVTSVAYAPNGKTIATGSEDYSYKIWKLEVKNNQLTAQVIQSSNHVLFLEGSNFQNAIGLNAWNKALLKYGGAKNIPEGSEGANPGWPEYGGLVVARELETHREELSSAISEQSPPWKKAKIEKVNNKNQKNDERSPVYGRFFSGDRAVETRTMRKKEKRSTVLPQNSNLLRFNSPKLASKRG